MRRGASLTEGNQRQPVVADMHDLEGGGIQEDPTGKPAYMRSSSTESASSRTALSPMDFGTPSAVPTPNKSHKRLKRPGGFSPALLSQQDPQSLIKYAVALAIGTVIICPFLSIEWCILTVVFAACAYGIIASLWLSQTVLKCDTGTPEMRQVSDPIREGAEGFLKVQYTAIAKFAIPLAGLIFISYQFRPASDTSTGVAILGNQLLGLVAALGFVAGALCSALSGYTSMWVASQSNIRVASAGRRSYGEALVICFRGGAFSAVLNLTLCIAGRMNLARDVKKHLLYFISQ